MKKITLLIVAILFSFAAQAQFTVTSNFGDINDGDVMTFESVEMHDAKVLFTITNTSNATINMRIKAVSIINTDGQNAQICLGFTCYNNVIEGETYPIGNTLTLAPGETSETNGSVPPLFWNQDPTSDNPDEPITYVLEFQQMDAAGLFVQNTLTYTYKFIPASMAVAQHEKSLDAQIVSTLISNGRLAIKTQKPVQVQVYNLLGQQVKNASLDNGMNTINVSDLTAQVYLVRLYNQQGQTKTQKIVIE